MVAVHCRSSSFKISLKLGNPLSVGQTSDFVGRFEIMAVAMKLFVVALLCCLANTGSAWRTKPKTRVEENQKKPQPEVQTSGYTEDSETVVTTGDDDEYVKKATPTVAYGAIGGGYGQTQPPAYEEPQTQAAYAPVATDAPAAYAAASTQAAAYGNVPSSPAYGPPSTGGYASTQGYANLEPLLQGQYEIKVITIRCVVRHPTSTSAALDPYAAAPMTTMAPAYGVPSTAYAAPAYGAPSTGYAAPAYGAASTYAAPAAYGAPTAAPAYGQPSTVADPYGPVKTEQPAYGAPSTELPYAPPMETTVDPVLKSIPLCPPGTFLSSE